MSIFDETPTDIVTIEEGKDYVSELVGDDKKFKDVQGLARGKLESDNYIKELTGRLDELRKELDSRTNLDTFLKEMKELKEVRSPSQTPQEQRDTPVPPTSKELDDSTIEETLSRLLDQRMQKQQSETNLEKVQKVLKDQFGDEASRVINHKANELGMTVKDLEGLATRSPSAFLTLVGVSSERQTLPSVPAARSSLNLDGKQVGVKNKAYFDKLKRDNPQAYWNPQTTVEMIKARRDCEARRIPWE